MTYRITTQRVDRLNVMAITHSYSHETTPSQHPVDIFNTHRKIEKYKNLSMQRFISHFGDDETSEEEGRDPKENPVEFGSEADKERGAIEPVQETGKEAGGRELVAGMAASAA